MAKILIVDDEPSILQLFQMALRNDKHEVAIFPSAQEVVQEVKNHFYDLVITDLSMPGMDGMDLILKIKEFSPETLVVMMTAYGSTEIAVKAMKYGAADYLTKPIHLDDLKKTVENAINKGELQRENQALRKVTTKTRYGHRLLGTSEQFKKMIEWIGQVSKTSSSVLILGESGTGKELVAREIHAQSERNTHPFVAVNCAAIPQHLIESELFGYAKGAFTGADQHRMGFFEASHHGTIFLDEIGELPLGLQSKLLRVLAEKKVVRLGSTREIPVDIRVISATNQSLDKMITLATFREDLFYRLNVLQIELPALRNRKEDIPLLASHFLQKFSEEYRKKMTKFEDSAIEALTNYSFPGNIRELINVIEQCVVLEDSSIVHLQTLPEKMRNKIKPESAGEKKFSLGGHVSLEKQVESYEKELILQALEKAKGIKTQAAKLLNISFRSLRYRLEKLGMLDESSEDLKD